MTYICKSCEANAAVIKEAEAYGVGKRFILECQSSNCLWSSRLFESEIEIDKLYGQIPNGQIPKPKKRK